MTINESKSLDLLATFDAHFGLLSAVAALREYGNTVNKNNLNFDIKEFIIKLRQFMSLEESYAGLHFDKEHLSICNLSKPDQILFLKGIKTGNIPDYSSRIFSEMKQEYFPHYKNPPEGERCYAVTKKLKEYSVPFLVQPLKNILSAKDSQHPDCFLSPYVDFSNYSVINNEKSFKTRTLLTEELNKVLSQIDIADFVQENSNISNETIDSFRFLKPMALIGTMREYPDQAVLYIISHCTNSNKKKLDEMKIILDNFILFAFEHNKKIKEILKKCSDLCKPSDHKCYIGKVLGSPSNSKDYCAMFFATFSIKIHKESQRKLPIRKLIRENRERLPEWDFYRNRSSEIYSFPLDNSDEEDVKLK